MSQADLLQYLKEHVLPDTFDVSGANKQRVLQFAGEAVEHYFECIQDDFSDVDMMSTGDKIDILQDLGELNAALSLELPRYAVFTDEEKIMLIHSLLEKQGESSMLFSGQSFFLPGDLAYHTLCRYLFTHQCFTDQHLRYLFQEDKYSSIDDIISNFHDLLESSFPTRVKIGCFALLPSLIKIENVPKVELIKKLTGMFVETQQVSDQEKQQTLQAILDHNVSFLQRCLQSFKPNEPLMMSRFYWRDTIAFRYVSNAYLQVSHVEPMKFFLQHHEGGVSYHKQQVLLGLFDYVRERYEQGTPVFQTVLAAGTISRYPVIRKISYEILFVLGDNLEETAQRCMEDNACEVRTVLGEVAVSTIKYKDLDQERRNTLVQLARRYKEKMRLTQMQKRRLETVP
ncbi:MAG: hypothetical protein QXX20_00560 [Candidatus Thermoplasmatota archaeon]